MKRLIATAGIAVVLSLGPVTLYAQEDTAGDSDSVFDAIDLGLGIAFGVASFEDPDTGEQVTYQALALQPDFGIGKFGLGLDLRINYRLNGGEDGDEFEIREEDWEVGDFEEFLEVYLPKFRYLRWGVKGDPLFALFGGFSSATLGTGFLVNNYSNELFVPDFRIFGGMLDFDGALVGFPYLGIESVIGNVAALDVMGARVYTRPLAGLSLPLLPALEIGGTVVTDQDPFYHLERDPDAPQGLSGDEIYMWGLDVMQPILQTDAVTLDSATSPFRKIERAGWSASAGGRHGSFSTERRSGRWKTTLYRPSLTGPTIAVGLSATRYTTS